MRKYLLWLFLILLVWCASAVAGERRFAIMFHTRSCSPCQQMLSNVVPVLQAKGLGIFPMDITGEDVPGVSFVPTTWIYDGDTRKGIKKFVGFTSAEAIESELSEQKAPVERTTVTQFNSVLPTVNTPWGRFNLNDYEKSHRGCNCSMCQGIRSIINSYRYRTMVVESPVTEKFGQDSTPTDVSEKLLDELQLESSDVYGDLGCGDGRLLIAAVRRSGCVAIGIEIDPVMVTTARRSVKAAGLSDRIAIIEGDARDFLPCDYGVTKLTAYLYPETLRGLAAQMAQAEIAASPYHEVEGLSGEKHGDIWVYRNR